MPRIDQALKNKIHDRVQILIEGGEVDGEYQRPMNKEALTAKLVDLLYKANDLRFTVGMALGDLGIHRDDDPAILKDLEDAFDDLDIPTI